jgi:uncharacterized protein (TIGR02611 family)
VSSTDERDTEVNGVAAGAGAAAGAGVAAGAGIAGGAAAVRPPGGRPRRWRRVQARARLVRQRVRAVPGGHTLLKVVIAALGAAVVALGLVLVPLPGPGWAIVFGGLAIWAIEFAWAARLLDWVRRQVRAFARLMSRFHWTIRAALALATLALLMATGWMWIKYRYGFETLSQFWEFLSH